MLKFNIYIMPEEKYKRRSKVSSFILRLLRILQNQETQSSVCWLSNGLGFQIINQVRFTSEVLPKYFKHRSLSSFIRQLNIYEFSRIKIEKNIAYSHPKFQKHQEHLFKEIKRKKIPSQSKRDPVETEKKSFQASQLTLLYECIQKTEKSCLRMMKENEILQKQIKNIQRDIKQVQTKRKEWLNCVGDFHSTLRKEDSKKNFKKWRSISSFYLSSGNEKRQTENLIYLVTDKGSEIDQILSKKLKSQNISDKTSDS